MKHLLHVNSEKLAIGIQSILLDMYKTKGYGKYPVRVFESLLTTQKDIDKESAKFITEKIISTGIIRLSIADNCFVL